MSDFIDRQAAIEEIARRDTTDGTVKVFSGKEVIEILTTLQPESSDCISRQAAIDAVRNYLLGCQIEDGDYHADGIMYELDCLPSAQPEIIRCKDCGKREICRTSTVWAVAPGDDWFCADAERRTDG